MQANPTFMSSGRSTDDKVRAEEGLRRPRDEREGEAFRSAWERQAQAQRDAALQAGAGFDESDTAPPAQAMAPPPLGASGAVNASAAPGARPGTDNNALSWAQISDCVERLLIEAGPSRPGDPSAVLTLHADLLADTSVALARSGHGWTLRLQSGDVRLLCDVKRHESALRDRFARHGLGELTVEHAQQVL
jgi:hypothetical protein